MTGLPQTADQTVVVVDDLGVVYGDQAALRGVTFTARRGERILIQGHNGAGKSTLIRVLAGLQRPHRGRVTIEGSSPAERHIRQRIGVALHNPWLDPDLTVGETLRFFGALYGLQDVQSLIIKVLSQVGLGDRLGQRVGELSRGYQQRLTLARAMLHEPSILLLDEPDTGLDEETLESIGRVLAGDAHPGQIIIMTSHNRAFGAALTNRALTLEHGRLVECASVAGV